MDRFQCKLFLVCSDGKYTTVNVLIKGGGFLVPLQDTHALGKLCQCLSSIGFSCRHTTGGFSYLGSLIGMVIPLQGW